VPPPLGGTHTRWGLGDHEAGGRSEPAVAGLHRHGARGM